VIEVLAQITAGGPKGFAAGIVLWDDVVVEAAPIVRYMRKWPRERVRAYCTQKGWAVSVVHQLTRERP
jgi:hypothetical protein